MSSTASARSTPTSPPSLFSSTANPELNPTSLASVQASLSTLASSLAASPSFAPGAANSSTPATNTTAGQPIVRTQTPIFACVPASYNVSGGTPPYPEVFLIRSGDVNATVLKTLPAELQAGTFSWGVDIGPGTSITFVAKDSLGTIGYSVPIIIQSSSRQSCLSGHSKESPFAIVGTVIGSLAAVGLILFAFFYYRRGAYQRTANGSSDAGKDFVEGPYGEMLPVRTRSTKLIQEGSRTAESAQLATSAEASGEANPGEMGELPQAQRSPSGQYGTYNLGGLDYTPQSLDAAIARRLEEEDGPPEYEFHRVRRAVDLRTTDGRAEES